MRAAWVLVALVLATGCGSSPPARFFALAPTPDSAGASTAAQSGPIRTIRLRRPSIPGDLDRPEVVRSVTGYRLRVGTNERWGGPLDEMIGRVLAQDIQQRLPGTSVFTEDGAITADPDVTVEVNVQRFEVGDGGNLALVAAVAVERAGGQAAATTRSLRLDARPQAYTASGIVAAMSGLLGQLADAITSMVRSPSFTGTWPPPGPPRAPE